MSEKFSRHEVTVGPGGEDTRKEKLGVTDKFLSFYEAERVKKVEAMPPEERAAIIEATKINAEDIAEEFKRSAAHRSFQGIPGYDVQLNEALTKKISDLKKDQAAFQPLPTSREYAGVFTMSDQRAKDAEGAKLADRASSIYTEIGEFFDRDRILGIANEVWKDYKDGKIMNDYQIVREIDLVSKTDYQNDPPKGMRNYSLENLRKLILSRLEDEVSVRYLNR